MWKMLNNGVCPPPPPKVFGFVTGDAGDGGMQMAIDNAGRVYAWGATSYGYSGQTPISITGTSNFWRHPDTYYETATPGNYHPATLKPIQVGTKSDFVKCRMGEDFYTALDSEGYLWGWGMPWSFGLGGWNDTAQYTGNGYPPTPFTPGGRHAITPQRLFDVVWKDFINGQYHMIAIKPDGSLWIWGKNLDGTTFGNNTYAEDYVSLVPIEMTWVPGPVKLVAAYWSVTAIVTESNQIWIWGEWWIAEWGVNGSVAAPMQLPLTVPTGVQITQISCSYSGVVVLLSNGDVYAAGYWFGFSSTYTTVLTKDPTGRHFVQIDVGETGAAGVDINGNIYGWGSASFLIYQPGWVEDTVEVLPTLTQPGPQYTHVSVGYWFHQAIDTEGRLWTWGRNEDGALGVDEKQTDLLYSYLAVEATYFAELDDGTRAIDAPGVGPAALQFTLDSPEQLSEHNPCGHWHKKAVGAPGFRIDIPKCCWNFAVDVRGTDVMLYGLGINYPCPVIPLRYNISTRQWYGPYWQIEKFYTREWLAGASISGAFDGLMMYGGDDAGILGSPSVTGHRIVIKTAYHNTGAIYERLFPSARPQNCEGKIVVEDTTGKVMVLIEVGTNIELWLSTDYGNTYTLGETWAFGTAYKYARIVRSGSNYYVSIFRSDGTSNGSITTYSSTDGLTWTSKAIISTPIGSARFNMWTDSNTIYLLCYDRLFYSTDGAMTFTSKTMTGITNHGFANGSTFDATMFYAVKLQGTVDYTLSTIVWFDLPVAVFEHYELTDFTTTRNSGDYGVYMRDNLFLPFGATTRIVLPVTQALGTQWELVQTPLIYFKEPIDSLHGEDDPRWRFSPTRDKIPLDPQYR